MPKDFIYETAITIDHEAHVMLVDTTQAGIASQLLRCGFQETTRPSSRPYRRFRGQADQIRFRRPKTQRALTLRGRAKRLAETLPGGRNPAQISTIAGERPLG